MSIAGQRRSAIIDAGASAARIALQLAATIRYRFNLQWMVRIGLLDIDPLPLPRLKVWPIPDPRPDMWLASLSLAPALERVLADAADLAAAAADASVGKPTSDERLTVAGVWPLYDFRDLAIAAGHRRSRRADDRMQDDAAES
ncbi:hypothetical protein [Methylobacterium sp. D54C]